MTEFELLKVRVDQNISGIKIIFNQPYFPDSGVRYFMDIIKEGSCLTVEWLATEGFGIHLPKLLHKVNHDCEPDEKTVVWEDVLYRVIKLMK